MELILIDEWNSEDRTARYYPKSADPQSIGDLILNSKITLHIDNSERISVISETLYKTTTLFGKPKYDKNPRYDTIRLTDLGLKYTIDGLKQEKNIVRVSLERYVSYSYEIELLKGTLYLSQEALEKICSAIYDEHKQIIQEKVKAKFLHAKEIASLWQAPWEEHQNIYLKIKRFTKDVFFLL